MTTAASSPELMVRPYQTADREALFQIGADTAFFGAPIEAYMEDRRIFLDSFYAYYTDYEPEHAWVACAGAQVVGFLTGCTNSRCSERVLVRKLIPGVLWRLLTGYYHPGKKTWRYVRAAITAGLRGESPPVDLQRYPAHLHINLAAEWRGFGLGQRLMLAYLDQLRQLGVRGVHLGTTSMNVAACRLYERTGFHLLGARPTRMWTGIIDHPVEILSYGMEL
jgi:GNAT superfamily N-acetyltransferase